MSEERFQELAERIEALKAELSAWREAAARPKPSSRRYGLLVRSPRSGWWRWADFVRSGAFSRDPEQLWATAECYRTGDEPAAELHLVELVTVRQWRDQHE